MKTKLFTLFLALIASARFLLASVQIGDLYYNLNAEDLTAEVTYKSYNQSTWAYNNNWSIAKADIPVSVYYNGQTYSVTSIGSYAFKSCSNLTSVTIPNSIISIGEYAFEYCRGLSSVTIPNSATSIGGSAFSDCSGLNSVNIGNSVTSIGGWAFSGCSSLTLVTIGNSVTSIGAYAFKNCSSLSSVVWNAKNCKDFSSTETPFYYNNYGSAFNFDIRSQITSFTFGNEVEHIPAYLCKGMINLTSVIIPNSVVSIGEYSFEDCSDLTTVTIGNSVTNIGEYAFYNCTGLTKVNISNLTTWCNIKFSDDSANPVYYAKHLFRNNVEIRELVIPNSVTSIGNYAFYGCAGLTSVTIPNSVTSIGDNAFYDCAGLTSVAIGKNVTSIGAYAFAYCNNMTSIAIPNSITDIGSRAFYNGLTSVMWNAKNCNDFIYNYEPFTSAVTSFTFGEEVEHIPANLCRGMSNLTSVIIPNSVSSIGNSAFYNCNKLSKLAIFATTPPTGGIYSGINAGNCTLYVPAEAIETYANSVWWKDFNDIKTIYEYNLVLDSWKEIIFSAAVGRDALPEDTIFTSDFEGFHAQITDPDNQMQIDANIARFGTLEDYDKYNLRLKTGRKSSSKNLITISVPSDGKLRVAARTGANNDETRTIIVKQGDDTLYNDVVKESQAVKVTEGEGDEALEVNVYPYIEVPVKKGVVVLTYPVNSVNFFAFGFEDASYTHVYVNSENGRIVGGGTYTTGNDVTIFAIPNYGYHFTQWNDGETENPRTFTITQDTTFTAEFKKNTYSIITESSNNVWGTTAGNSSALYLEQVEISATANYGYHFTQWSDGMTENPRTIELTQDTTFVAEFAPNKYSISVSCDEQKGKVASETGEFDYLSELVCEAIPLYGYHFDKWSDGNTDNPRTIVLTRDTTLIAEYALDLSGLCGRDSALSWGYEPDNAVLTISGSGELTDNYTYSVVAKAMKTLILSEGVTKIGKEAFRNNSNLIDVTLPNSLTEIGRMAFCKDSLLSSITIPENVTNIGTAAFGECISLQTITIPENVSDLASGATFQNCASLKSVVWNAINCTLSQGEDSKIYAPFIKSDSITSFTFGSKVETIPQWLCAYRAGLTEIIIPESVISIGDYAFSNCSSLTSVTIPSSVTSIGYAAFAYCTGVTFVTIPNSVISIGNYAFYDCSNLIDIYATCGDLDRVKQLLKNDNRVKYKPLPYTINVNATNGSVSFPQNSCDALELIAIPDYGYHFAQWSDGVKDNPRTIELTCDTSFTAEFALDKSGTCGYDNLLTWKFDESNKTLVISGNGSLNSNYTYGVEAPTQTERLIIEEGVTSIGDNAFSNMTSLITSLALPSTVTFIGDSAFAGLNNRKFNTLVLPNTIINIGAHAFDGASYLQTIHFGSVLEEIGAYAFNGCVRVKEMTCLAEITPNVGTDGLTSISNLAKLYVPVDYLFDYQIDNNWNRFDLQTLGATETTVTDNEVKVEPDDNSVVITWPTNDNAATYTIAITKDNEVVCRLIFNADGQLTGIAFAPSRNGTPRQAPAAQKVENGGMQFTVTGLNSGTQYGYSVTAKDANDQPVATYSGEFTTTSEGIATGVEEVSSSLQGGDRGRLILRNGQILILRGDKTYTVTGQEVR